VVPVLSKWIVVRNPDIDWQSPRFLMNLVEEIQKESSKYQKKRNIPATPSRNEEMKGRTMEEEQDEELFIEKKKTPRAAAEIDLITFCLLCNRLIMILE
jgi:hypothetical protein